MYNKSTRDGFEEALLSDGAEECSSMDWQETDAIFGIPSHFPNPYDHVTLLGGEGPFGATEFFSSCTATSSGGEARMDVADANGTAIDGMLTCELLDSLDMPPYEQKHESIFPHTSATSSAPEMSSSNRIKEQVDDTILKINRIVPRLVKHRGMKNGEKSIHFHKALLEQKKNLALLERFIKGELVKGQRINSHDAFFLLTKFMWSDVPIIFMQLLCIHQFKGLMDWLNFFCLSQPDTVIEDFVERSLELNNEHLLKLLSLNYEKGEGHLGGWQVIWRGEPLFVTYVALASSEQTLWERVSKCLATRDEVLIDAWQKVVVGEESLGAWYTSSDRWKNFQPMLQSRCPLVVSSANRYMQARQWTWHNYLDLAVTENSISAIVDLLKCGDRSIMESISHYEIRQTPIWVWYIEWAYNSDEELERRLELILQVVSLQLFNHVAHCRYEDKAIWDWWVKRASLDKQKNPELLKCFQRLHSAVTLRSRVCPRIAPKSHSGALFSSNGILGCNGEALIEAERDPRNGLDGSQYL